MAEEESKEISIWAESPGHLFLSTCSLDEGGIYLNGSYEGTKKTSSDEALILMSDFIRHSQLRKIDQSHLCLTLANQQGLVIEHNAVEQLGQHFYRIELFYPAEKKNGIPGTSLMPALASIVKNLYGLCLGQTIDDRCDHFAVFQASKKPSTGIIVSGYGGLKYGTVPEKEARALLRKQKFSREEKKVLRRYDSALVENKPETGQLKGNIIQNKGPLLPGKFVSLLDSLQDELPEEVGDISLHLEGTSYSGGYFHIALCNYLRRKNQRGIPEVDVCYSIDNKKEINRIVDLLWNDYHELTGVTMEQAWRKSKKKEEEWKKEEEERKKKREERKKTKHS